MCLSQFPRVMCHQWQAESFRRFLSMMRKWKWFHAGALVLLAGILLTSCSGLNFGGSSGPTPKSTATSVTSVTLAKLHWCGKPLMIFRDEGATTTGAINLAPTVTDTPVATATTATPTSGVTPTVTTTPSASSASTLNDWSQVEAKLGFTTYLPAMLPHDACLNSASGTIHDPIFGGSFTIGYLLPDHSALTFSEAPVRTQNATFQCSETTTTGSSVNGSTKTGTPAGASTASSGHGVLPLQICTGARDTTNIVFSARGTTNTLEQLFHALQPNVVWIPIS